jgi:hypothetical protein
LDHRPLELGEHTEHLKQRPTRRGRRIDRLFSEVKIDANCFQLGERGDQVVAGSGRAGRPTKP